VEPVLGEGGDVVPPPAFLPALGGADPLKSGEQPKKGADAPPPGPGNRPAQTK
jgi:hypothetical protein